MANIAVTTIVSARFSLLVKFDITVRFCGTLCVTEGCGGQRTGLEITYQETKPSTDA